MPVVTPEEVVQFTNITASVTSIIESGYIASVQETINMATNNYFVGDLHVQNTMVFDPVALTIVSGDSFTDFGFADGDEIYICNSYRNDGYQTIATVTGSIITLASGSTIYSELSGRSIMISVVKWPLVVRQVAAQMVRYDYDVRPVRSSGVKSRTLGPLSEQYSDEENEYGYPNSIMDRLIRYRIARLF
jgi:hypothetical protein